MGGLEELKEKAIKDFFKAWREIYSYGLEVFNATTYEKIDIGDIIIDDSEAQ